MLMSLFRWESRILNKIYKTNKFTELEHLKLSNPENIDYKIFLQHHRSIDHQIHKKQIDPQFKEATSTIVDSANLLCRPGTKSTVLQKEVMRLNQMITKMKKNQGQKKQEQKEVKPQKNENNNANSCYTVEHVIAYSSLSKCRIWPKVLKSGRGFVPNLIDFYNQFTNQYNDFLDFKFDPIILSQKYTKIMKKVHSKKRDYPELIKELQKNNIAGIIKLLFTQEQECTKLQNLQEIKQKLTQKDKNMLSEQLNGIIHKGLCISHIAVEQCSEDIIHFLGDIGIDFQALDNQNQTALFYAVKRADLSIMKYLVEQLKVQINHREYQKRTALYLASFEGNIEIVDYLFKHGADPQLPSKLDRTPLSKACYLGNVKVVQYLLNIGVDMLKKDVKGRTALHNAVWGIEGGRDGKRRGHIRLEDSPQSAQLLLKAGHPIQFIDNDGFTPLFSAVSSRANRSLEVLVKYGANLAHQTNKQQSCVFIASKYGHLDTIKILIEQLHCEYLKTDIHGYTPLCASITLPDPDVFIYLSNLHFQTNEPLNCSKLLQCCLQYDRVDNWRYLWQWIEEQQTAQNKKQDQISTKTQQKLPWLKKKYQEYHNMMTRQFFKSENKQQLNIQQVKDNKVDYLFKQLQSMSFFIPLLNGLHNSKDNSQKTLQKIFDLPKMTNQEEYHQQQEQETQEKQFDDEKALVNQIKDSQLNQLVLVKQIDPLIRTNIKSHVPTITTKMPSIKQIQSEITKFLCVFMQIILHEETDKNEKIYKKITISKNMRHQILQKIGPINFQNILNALIDCYKNFSHNPILIDTILLAYEVGNKVFDHKIQIDNWEITPSSSEKDLLRILYNCDSNLTTDTQKLMKTMMRLVKYRLTGVLINIYNNISDIHNNQEKLGKVGIAKFTKQQLLIALICKNYTLAPKKSSKKSLQKQEKNQQNNLQESKKQQIQNSDDEGAPKLSLLEYCLVNRISDIYVYFQNILKANQINLNLSMNEQIIQNSQKIEYKLLSVKIPSYDLKRIQLKQQQIKINLEPVSQWVFNYDKIIEKLSPKQKYIYRNCLLNENHLEHEKIQQKEQCLFETCKNYTMVNTFKKLQILRQQIDKSLLIGIDTEYYNHSKQSHFICSIQIAVAGHVFIVDPLSQAYYDCQQLDDKVLSQKRIGNLIRQIMADENKIKILHAYQNDLRWLNQDYSLHVFDQYLGANNKLCNIVDTGRIFSCRQGKGKASSVGLRCLGQKYLRYQMKKDFQRSDWRIRPLFSEMIQYGAIDAEILCFIFLQQLKEQKNQKNQKLLKQMFGTFRSFKSKGVRYQIIDAREKKIEKKKQQSSQHMI